MKRAIRNVGPESVRDLLERVPRACIAFATDNGPQAQPIVFVYRDGRYLARVPSDAEWQASTGQEVVLLSDEGIHYFELRAIYIRGRLEAAAAPSAAPTGCTWFEVVPIKTVGWDYGMLREVEDEG